MACMDDNMDSMAFVFHVEMVTVFVEARVGGAIGEQ